MFRLGVQQVTPPLRSILCLGAHCDDIEIGCGGTILKLLDDRPDLQVTWVVFSSDSVRRVEALKSAAAFLSAAHDVRVGEFRDGFLPSSSRELKEQFEELKNAVSPDLVFTHYRHDLHQDHRLISDLTWQTFRDHLILEYEIPKYDGDLGSPNVFVHLDEAVCRRKAATILSCFKTQTSKRWFAEDLFMALLRLRGMECNSETNYAEAFYCRKLVVA
ncbi:MAG TPA: PIG-L deacetylase family protein [Acidimicrobiia bacterium]